MKQVWSPTPAHDLVIRIHIKTFVKFAVHSILWLCNYGLYFDHL